MVETIRKMTQENGLDVGHVNGEISTEYNGQFLHGQSAFFGSFLFIQGLLGLFGKSDYFVHFT